MGTIKIIKGVGPKLSTERLEAVSTQLLLARIRGSDPQVSFTFIQRLLDELIQRRRQEELEELEMDIIVSDLDDLPREIVSLPNETAISSLHVESIDGLELLASDYQEIPEPDPKYAGIDDLEFPEFTPEEIAELSEYIDEKERAKPKVEELVLEHPAVKNRPKKITPELSEPVPAESEPELPAKPKRKPFVLKRKPESIWRGEINFLRIVAITALVAFLMVCGVIAF